MLARVLSGPAAVLEIASGSGQHAEHFAAARSDWDWQPTEADATALASIASRTAALGNVRPPLMLDVLAPRWPESLGRFDALYCANMLHIAEWATCAALMGGAARHLVPGGVLVLYGPYLVDDEPTAPGNVRFRRRPAPEKSGLGRAPSRRRQRRGGARRAGVRTARRHAGQQPDARLPSRARLTP